MEPWVVGLLLVFVGCFSSAIGLLLMKHSTSAEAALPFFRRKFWFLGFTFLIVNALVIDVVALALAPLSLVAPFSGVTIVIASWLASSGLVFVKETLDWWDTTSTCIALVGVTVTSIFGSHASPVYSAADLYAYFSKPAFQAYLALSLSALAVLWLLYAANVGQLRTKAAWFSIVLFSYTSAAFGSASLLLLKVVGSGIRVALQTGTAAFGSRLYVVSLAVLVLCALAQLAFLHFTLANSPVSYGVPTYQTLLTVLTIVSGGVFFSEFDRMPPAHFVCFVAGVAISLLGVALHASHRHRLERAQAAVGAAPDDGHAALPIATQPVSAATGPTHTAYGIEAATLAAASPPKPRFHERSRLLPATFGGGSPSGYAPI